MAIDTEKPLLEAINQHFTIQSILYDLDLLPEQIERGTREWWMMSLIVMHMKSGCEDSKRMEWLEKTAMKPVDSASANQAITRTSVDLAMSGRPY